MDPIGDLLARIKNGYLAYRKSVQVPSSKMKKRILDILKRKNYISDYKESKDKREFEIILSYADKKSAMTNVLRVSKPGLRVYSGWRELPRVMNGFGICIISTSKGILTDNEARKMKMGGEILCKIW